MANKLLVFHPHRPYPPQTGMHYAAMAELRAFKALGYEIHVFGSTLASDLPWGEEGIAYLKDTFNAQVHLYRHDLLDSIYLTRRAQESARLWTQYNPPWFLDAFKRVFEQVQPDVVVVHYAWWGALAMDPLFDSAVKLMVSHDSLLLNERLLNRVTASLPDPVDPRQMPAAVVDESFFEDILDGNGEQDCEEYRIYDAFDATIAVSEFDLQRIRDLTTHTAAVRIPVTCAAQDLDNQYSGGAVMVGSRYPMNHQGYAYFANRVLPAVRDQAADFTLQVAGGMCGHVLPVPGVELLGYVPDLKTLYRDARFAVCPVLAGTGMQTKIVEAMAHGLPVVALDKVAASSPIEHGVNGFVAKSAQEFALLCLQLWRDPQRCAEMGRAARQTIAEHFNPDVQIAAWREAIAAGKRRRAARLGLQEETQDASKSDQERALFIVGNGRSGTTVLSDSFNLADDVLLLNEADLAAFHDRRNFVEEFNDKWENKFPNLDVPQKGRSIPEFAAKAMNGVECMRQIAQRYPRYGIKCAFGTWNFEGTPIQDVFFDFHRANYPQATYIGLIRRPTEVVWSMQKYLEDDRSVSCLEAWLRSFQLLLRCHEHFVHTRQLCFEDLCAESVQELAASVGVQIRIPAGMIDSESQTTKCAGIPAQLDHMRALLERAEALYGRFRDSLDLQRFRFKQDLPGDFLLRMQTEVTQLLNEVVVLSEGNAADGEEPSEKTAPSGRTGYVMNGTTTHTAGQPRISIVTPALNCAAYIRQCIESVVDQGYPNFEHIIVDGGSSDGTVEILKEYPHLRWISEPDEGEPDALNKALAMAEGDIIGWLNADDFYVNDALHVAAAALDHEAGIDVVYGKVVLLGEADHPIGARVPGPGIDLHRLLRWHRTLHLFQPTMFFSRQVFEAVGPFRLDLPYAVDLDYWIRIAQQGFSFHYLDRTLAKMRLMREDGKSVTSYARKDEDWLRACLPALPTLSAHERVYFWKDYYMHRLVNGALYGEAPLRSPADREQAVGLGLAIIDANAVSDGSAYLERVVEQYPDCADLFRLLGEAKNRTGDPSAAIRAFDAADAICAGAGPLHANEWSRADESRPTAAEPKMSSADVGAVHAPYGINVIGYVSGSLGVGVTARSVTTALLERGYDVTVLDVDAGNGRTQGVELPVRTVHELVALPAGINLFVLPLADLAAFVTRHADELTEQGNFNAAWCVWELSVLPQGWSDVLGAMDALVAQSDFIRHALAFSVSGVPVLNAQHPLQLPETVEPDRARFGLPAEATLFLTSFDPNSDPKRKNPEYTLAAFEQACGRSPDAHLVIKIPDPSATPAYAQYIEELKAFCDARDNVHLIATGLSYQDVLCLTASCDVYVSLHRAEGLGLGMLEAMALGKPVIATGWSGNASFMNHANACPVNYRLVPVDGSIQAYSQARLGSDAVWADADVAEAAQWMRRLQASPQLRSELGERARRDARMYLEQAARVGFVDELWNILAQRQQHEQREQSQSTMVEACGPATRASDLEYGTWIDTREFRPSERVLLEERASAWRNAPTFQVVTVVQPGQEALLADTLDSLDGQVYGHWHLTVCAPFAAPSEDFLEHAQVDWCQVPTKTTVAQSVNWVAANSERDWLVYVPVGDRLNALGLYRFADMIDDRPTVQLLYGDEDSVGEDGERMLPAFKPGFDPDLLRSWPYVGDALAVRRRTFLDVGGYGLDGAENYDLLLRLWERFEPEAFQRVEHVVLHARPHGARGESVEGIVQQNAAAVSQHLQRSVPGTTIEAGPLPGTHRLRYPLLRRPLVSIIVPTRNAKDLLAACVESIQRTTDYDHYELLVVDNGSDDDDALAYLAALPERFPKARVLRFAGEYNFSAINNFAARQAKGEVLLLLNNDTEALHGNWLEEMLSHALRPEVGVVGARLLFPDGKIQHAGVVTGMGANGVAEHPCIGVDHEAPGYLGRAQVVQQVSAVTGACLMVGKALYEQLSGLDERELPVMYNDIDLCLKARTAGRAVVWTPFATLMHHGSVSLKDKQYTDRERAAREAEVATMLERWAEQLAADPFYNRNLSLKDGKCEVDVEIAVGWDRDHALRPRLLGMGFGSDGSWQHRVAVPLQTLESTGVAQTGLLPKYKDRVRVPSVSELRRERPDTLLLHNCVHDVHLDALERYRRFTDTFLVFSQDDLMTQLPASNPFRDRIYRDIKQRLRKAIGLCDRLVVTTEPLAEAYRDMGSEIVVQPNYLPRAVWGELQTQRRDGAKPRVGWAGAQQHVGDLALIMDLVKQTAKEVDWVFFGLCLEELLPYVAEVVNPVAFEQYPQTLTGLDLDLAIAPLERNRFNECKSNLKLLEYGALGIPVVCTDIAPYQSAPVKRVPNRTADWVSAIRERVADRDAAAAEGQQLRRWVHQHWLLEDRLDAWLDALTPGALASAVEAGGS